MGKEPLLYKEETGQIIGCAMDVLNAVGHGLYEKVYENALVVELGLADVPTRQQPEYPVIYKGVTVGKYIPDLICFETVIVDAKTIEKISDHEVGKMINYLRITGCRVGLIVNFKRAKLEWKRVVV